MDYRFVRVRIEQGVGWLEYNRPPVNAFHWDMVREVTAAARHLLGSPSVRAVVFASALEKHFSAGAELQVFDGIGPEAMREWTAECHALVRTLRGSGKPLLAAIHGIAVGGGLEMVLHCDQRFAAADARLGQPEVNINFIPPVGGTQALARLLGRSRAIRFLYDGALVSAAEALAMGLVDVVCPPERLREEVGAYAATLAGKPPEALAAIRRCVTEGGALAFEDGLRVELEAAVELAGTRNFAEGVRAFLEKRRPVWTRTGDDS